MFHFPRSPDKASFNIYFSISGKKIDEIYLIYYRTFCGEKST